MEEIANFFKYTEKISEVAGLSMDILEESFHSDFITDDFIMKSFDDKVNECAKRWTDNETLYAPILVISQSSGYGKTKMLYEYANKYPTVFLCIRDDKELTGYPAQSRLKNELIYALKKSCLFSFIILIIFLKDLSKIKN